MALKSAFFRRVTVIALATGIAWACGGSSEENKGGGGDDDDAPGGQSGSGVGGSSGGSSGRGGTAGGSGDAGAGDTGGQPDRGGTGGRGGTSGATSGGTAGTPGGEGGQPGGAAGGGSDDPCDPNPCLNGGTCRDDAGSAACTCINGYVGNRCQTTGIMEACTTTCGTPGMRGCESLGMNCGPCQGTEVCNNCDDDGVGGPDDTFMCVQGRSSRCTTTCGTVGSRTCANDCSGLGACTATEVCNGCDDDGVGGPDNTFACVRNQATACTTSCGTPGMHTCANDCSGYGYCTTTEVCNGCDDDRVGGPDNGFTCVQNQPSACTTACGTPGTHTCNSTCDGFSTCLAGAEVCGNNCDDDGVGGADNGCSTSNDLFANATPLALGPTEITVTGTTVGATRDGQTVACICTSGGNVWYSFTLATAGAVYFDTAGSALDTSLFITDSTGTPVPGQAASGRPDAGLCNDDSGCTMGDWTSSFQSRTFGYFTPGTYYLSVGGCGSNTFVLHAQYVASTVGRFFYSTRLAGDTTTSDFLLSTSITTGMCGGAASGEDVRWMATCGGGAEFFSLCQSDGGTYSRTISTTNYDPTMYVRSAQTGTELVCNDDGTTAGGTNCQGTGGDASNYGSRINNVIATRGITSVFVDALSGASGMTYTLRYTVPN